MVERQILCWEVNNGIVNFKLRDSDGQIKDLTRKYKNNREAIRDMTYQFKYGYKGD